MTRTPQGSSAIGAVDSAPNVPVEPVMQRLHRSLKQLQPGQIRRRIRHLQARVHPSPIIVLGTQKSGTTAVCSLLALATGESLTSDVFYRYQKPIELRLLAGELDFERFVRRYRAHFATGIIKEPSFTFMYTGLKRTFPQAQYVFVLRDPRDTIRSVLDRLKLPGDRHELEPELVQQLKPYHGWGLILNGFGLPHGETYIDRLALRWRVAAELLLEERETFVVVRYEEFMQNKVETIRRLTEQLAVPFRHDIRDRVDVQFQPAGNREWTWEAFFGRDNLLRIERICGEPMAGLGYQAEAMKSE